MRSELEVKSFLEHLKSANGDEYIAFGMLKGRKPSKSKRVHAGKKSNDMKPRSGKSTPSTVKKGNSKKRKSGSNEYMKEAMTKRGGNIDGNKRAKKTIELNIDFNSGLAKVVGPVVVDGKEAKPTDAGKIIAIAMQQCKQLAELNYLSAEKKLSDAKIERPHTSQSKLSATTKQSTAATPKKSTPTTAENNNTKKQTSESEPEPDEPAKKSKAEIIGNDDNDDNDDNDEIVRIWV